MYQHARQPQSLPNLDETGAVGQRFIEMVAQIPALFELLSGTRMGDLMSRVPALSNQDTPAASNGHTNGTANAVESSTGEKQ